MSESAPTYHVHDYCAACGELLQPAPLGGRYACHPAEAMYWSQAVPNPQDLRGYIQLTGREPRIQTEWIEPGTGRRHDHAPLFLYRRLT
jgi:hypothetical protein